jgi:hypothetical protein
MQLHHIETLCSRTGVDNFEIEVFFRRHLLLDEVGTVLADSSGMRKFTIVIVVAALFASTAAVSVRHQRRWTEKLDLALLQASKQETSEPIRILIRVRPGSTDRLMAHLVQHGLKPEPMSTPDLIAVQTPVSTLRPIAGDADVVRLSSDAIVRAE